MSFLNAAPDALAAASRTIADIGSTLGSANTAASEATHG
ncbi:MULTISPECIES: PE domain-containing protein [Mycobacterium]|nr:MULTISPECIES: PE domain-containing protein [Mycobacterium]